MRNHLQFRRGETVNHCAICDGRFGLIRHYSWRTALCSRKCVDRFKSREENDRRWLPRFCTVRQPVTASVVTFRNEEAAS
jgi:hypothetical protein